MRIKFDDDNLPRGIEGYYEITDDTCIVYVNPTSPGIDWLINFIAFPVPVDITEPLGPWCHAGFKKYAYWLTGMIYSLQCQHQFKKLYLTGFSAGGGVAQLAGLLCQEWLSQIETSVLSIDGPRTTTRLPENMRLVRNRGSLVADIPPWFKKADETILNNQWRPFWKAHADYDIEKILKEYTDGQEKDS